MAPKAKRMKIISPIGLAQFPKLNTPDTKFNSKGVYECSLVLDPNDEDADWMLEGKPAKGVQNFLNLLDSCADKGFEESKVEFKESKKNAKTKAKRDAKFDVERRDPYDIEVDDEGVETGLVIVKTRTNASYEKELADGTTTTIKTRPGLFDARGKPFDVDIWGGTKLRLQFSLSTYVMLANSDAGASKRLNAAQVLSLVSSGGGDAQSYGFGVVDGGYEAPEATEKVEDDSDNAEDGEDYGSAGDADDGDEYGASGEESTVESSEAEAGSEEGDESGEPEPEEKPEVKSPKKSAPKPTKKTQPKPKAKADPSKGKSGYDF